MKWIKSHVISTLISKFGISFCALGVVIITSKILGAEGRGAISYALLLITMAQVFAEFISGSSIINLSASKKMIDLLLPSYLAILTVGSMFYLGFIFKLWDCSIDPLLLAANFVFLCVSNTHLSIILGRKHINIRNGIQLVTTLVLLFLVYFFYWLSASKSVSFYFVLLLISNVLSWVISSIWLYLLKTHQDFKAFSYQIEVHKMGFWSQLSQVVNILNTRLAYFVVRKDFGDSALGIYSNALNIGEKLKIVSHSLAQVQHNRIINNSDANYQIKVSLKYFRLNALLSVAQVIIVLALPYYFWTWLLGTDFIELRNMLLWLAPGFLALGLATSFSFYFHAIGHFKTVLIVNLATLATMVLCYLLTKNYLGFNAILLAFSLGYIVQLIVFVILFFNKSSLKNNQNYP